MFEESSPDILCIEKSMIPPWTSNHRNMIKIKDKVLFIQYTTGGTAKAIWYLVQVDVEYILKINPLCIKMVNAISRSL